MSRRVTARRAQSAARHSKPCIRPFWHPPNFGAPKQTLSQGPVRRRPANPPAVATHLPEPAGRLLSPVPSIGAPTLIPLPPPHSRPASASHLQAHAVAQAHCSHSHPALGSLCTCTCRLMLWHRYTAATPPRPASASHLQAHAVAQVLQRVNTHLLVQLGQLRADGKVLSFETRGRVIPSRARPSFSG